MTSENPYQPPDPIEPEKPRFVPLEIDREPLVDLERDYSGFEIDFNYIDGLPDGMRAYAELAERILRQPTAIFRDLKRENHEESLCYCGSPVDGQNRTGHVILFCATPVGDRGKLVVFHFQLKTEDPQRRGFPADMTFGEQIWP